MPKPHWKDRKPLSPAQLGLGIAEKGGPSREEYAARMRERDAREAQDTRTVLQELLGEPPPTLCALAKLEPPKPKRTPTPEDIAAALAFSQIVSDRLRRIATVSRTRVRLQNKE